jgi:hypothetical protein
LVTQLVGITFGWFSAFFWQGECAKQFNDLQKDKAAQVKRGTLTAPLDKLYRFNLLLFAGSPHHRVHGFTACRIPRSVSRYLPTGNRA